MRWVTLSWTGLALLILSEGATAAPFNLLPGFRASAYFGEQVREEWIGEGVRVVANAPGGFDAKCPTRLVIFATPNGNTIEQTLGCGPAEKLDWHFDIQHVSAQIRRLREVCPGENIVLACVESEGLSWPAWKRKYADGLARVRKVVETLTTWIPDSKVRITLAGHSGGGSFLFGFIDSVTAIPEAVERFVFLDANYSYSDADKHGDKLMAWLKLDNSRRLVVIAYDDRNIMLNSKPVIGPDDGTFRATARMCRRFSTEIALAESTTGEFVSHTGLKGQAAFHVHPNPKNRILHTALVGEMNGLLQGMTEGDPKPGWGSLGEPRAYAKWVQPAPVVPSRPADAVGGTAFMAKIGRLTPTEREVSIAEEIGRGNIPDFLRTFHPVALKATDSSGKEHSGVIDVMPDYLAVGSDRDFVRVPMTPMTAARIADQFGCSLPTCKIANDVYRHATVKLEPRPLTVDREAVETFVQHNAIIERQREGKRLGELVAGIKKDVVITNRLSEKPNKVAIYGWHKLDGVPVQPLTIIHRSTYVDYSHGVRLVKRAVIVDGKPRDIRPATYSADSSALFSDEGPITRPAY